MSAAAAIPRAWTPIASRLANDAASPWLPTPGGRRVGLTAVEAERDVAMGVIQMRDVVAGKWVQREVRAA